MVAFIVGCSSPRMNQTTEVQKFFELDVQLEYAALVHFADGGTYALELKDIHGSEVVLCISSARFTQVVPKEKARLPETDEYLTNLKKIHVYVGAPHPYSEEAEEVEYRSELEVKILNRLQEFSERNPQYEEDLSRFISSSQTDRKFDVIYE